MCVCVKCVGVCQVLGVCWVKYECKVCVIRDRVNCVCVGVCKVCVCECACNVFGCALSVSKLFGGCGCKLRVCVYRVV